MAASMDSDDEDTFVTVGTPLELIDEDEVPKKAPALQDQTVKDQRGRQRFHGAFTGGFSAGFFNTVGSKEGFVPSTFVSSRSQKPEASDGKFGQRPEDFMDDETAGDSCRMAESNPHPIVTAEEELEEGQLKRSPLFSRPQTAPGQQKEGYKKNTGDEDSKYKDIAIGWVTKLQQSPWYQKQGPVMKGMVIAAVGLLNLQTVTGEITKEIIGSLILGILVNHIYDSYKPYATRQFAPFKSKLDLVCKWLVKLHEMEQKIIWRLHELERLLKAVAAKEKDNFESEEWMLFKVELRLVEKDLREFVRIIDRNRPELKNIRESFDKKDEQYKKECRSTKEAWDKWVPSYKLCFSTWCVLLAIGVGTNLFEKIRPTAGAVGAGLATVFLLACPGLLEKYAFMRYSSDIDIDQLLMDLDAKIQYYEGKKDFKGNLQDMNAADLQKYLADFDAEPSSTKCKESIEASDEEEEDFEKM